MQKSIALSSYEVEYVILKEAVKEFIKLKKVFKNILLLNLYKTVILYCNNKSAINLLHNSEYHVKSKYIDMQCYFIRGCVEQKFIDLNYISTKDQLTNALTKTLLINAFRNFTNKINIKENM